MPKVHSRPLPLRIGLWLMTLAIPESPSAQPTCANPGVTLPAAPPIREIVMHRTCPACGRRVKWTGSYVEPGSTSWSIECDCPEGNAA